LPNVRCNCRMGDWGSTCDDRAESERDSRRAIRRLCFVADLLRRCRAIIVTFLYSAGRLFPHRSPQTRTSDSQYPRGRLSNSPASLEQLPRFLSLLARYSQSAFLPFLPSDVESDRREICLASFLPRPRPSVYESTAFVNRFAVVVGASPLRGASKVGRSREAAEGWGSGPAS
jgi:hypothetical protein